MKAGRLAAVRLFAGLGLIQLMLVPPGIIVIDGISMFATARSLATGLDFSVPCAVSGVDAFPGADLESVQGRGGACFSLWYPLLPVLAAPLVAIGEAVGGLAGVRGANVGQVLALAIPALASAAAGTVVALLAMRLGATPRRAIFAAVAFMLGTEALTYARSFFAETLAALLVAAGVAALTGGRRAQAGAAAAFALVVLAKPQLVVVGPAAGLALALATRRPLPLLAGVSGAAAGALLYGAYNWTRFGDPATFGGAPLFSFANYVPPRLFEISGLYLVSPGKGLLVYSPVAVLGAWALWRRRDSPLAVACLAGAASVLAVYIGHSEPYLGHSWGGRYLVPALPLLCAGLGALPRRAVALGGVLAVAALVSQIPTTGAFYERTFVEHEARGVVLARHAWSPSHAPLVNAWPAMFRQIRDARATDARQLALSASSRPAASVDDTQLLQVVALWWWLLPALGIAWWAGAAFAVVITAIGAWLVWTAAGTRRPARPWPPPEPRPTSREPSLPSR